VLRKSAKIDKRIKAIFILSVFCIMVLFKSEIIAIPPGDKKKVDMAENYASGFRTACVVDLSNDHLIKALQTTENFEVKF
jgi:hypothetical protein